MCYFVLAVARSVAPELAPVSHEVPLDYAVVDDEVCDLLADDDKEETSEQPSADVDSSEAVETDFVAGDAVESMRDAVGAVPDPSSRSDVRDAEAVLTRSQALRIIHGRRPPKLGSLDAQLLAFASCCGGSVFVWGIAFSHTWYTNEPCAWKVLCERLFQWEVVTALFSLEELLPHVTFGRKQIH